MYTLTFLCGMGCGSLVAVVIILSTLHLVLRSRKSDSAQFHKNHEETLAEMQLRNRLLAEQNALLRGEDNQGFLTTNL